MAQNANNYDIFSMPVTRKHQTSMKRRLTMFSSALFLLILLPGSIAFIILMDRIVHANSGNELVKTVEVERLRLEAFINGKIEIVLKMADSPIIKRFFENPDDPVLEQYAFEEIEAYNRALLEKSMFWINDKDKIYHSTDFEPNIVNPQNQENYWYNMTLYETEIYNLNINHNPDLDTVKLWINAPVINDEKKPIGIVGAGIDLTFFINVIFQDYKGNADLYFFNHTGEITGARDIDHVKDKTNIRNVVGRQTGTEIMDRVKNITNGEIIFFDTKDANGIVTIGAINVPNWYLAAIHYFTIWDTLQTGMTILFIIMTGVIFAVFLIFNIFAAKLLEPLQHIIKKINKISSDWELPHQSESAEKDEFETLGEFLNMTIIDPLTGIYNRRFFDGNMKKTIKMLSRTGSPLSLLMIDIDFFKKYNDTYGHDTGDTCLKEIASSLSKCFTRDDDFAARFGGEEFAVVLPNTDEGGAAFIAQKLLNKIRSCGIPHKTNPVEPFVTVSIGGTTGNVNYNQDANDYIKRADSALYKSKNNGRNQYTHEKME